MAKAKKIAPETEVAVVAQTKEVALKDIDFHMEPAHPITFVGNYSEVKKDLEKRLKKYKGLKVTDANMRDCELVKAQVVSLRTMLTNRKKEAVKIHINLPKAELEKKYDDLLAIAAEVEDALKEQFDVFDKERTDQLKLILLDYIAEKNLREKLDEKYLALVVLKEKYFNKTQKEKDTYADIDEQFSLAKQEKENYDMDVALIKRTIGKEDRINADHWIRQLEHRSASAIAQDIEDEKERLNGVDARRAAEGNEDPVEAVIGDAGEMPEYLKSEEKNGADFDPEYTSEVNDKMVTKRFEITYPSRAGDKINAFFNTIPNVKIKVLK